jgi:hypothetical protein
MSKNSFLKEITCLACRYALEKCQKNCFDVVSQTPHQNEAKEPQWLKKIVKNMTAQQYPI